MRAGRALIAVVLLAAPLTLLDDGRALADDITPVILPDRIDDVLSTPPDPYPTFDNFAWRAFVSLNWPSLTGPDGLLSSGMEGGMTEGYDRLDALLTSA